MEAGPSRDTRPLPWGVTPQGCLQQYQDPYAFRKVSLTKHLLAACSALAGSQICHRH